MAVFKYKDKQTGEWVAVESLGVQPDLSQNDETAKDYVKNRPFYSEGEFRLCQMSGGGDFKDIAIESSGNSSIPWEQQIIDNLDGKGSSFGMYDDPTLYGGLYRVTFDGVVYERTEYRKPYDWEMSVPRAIGDSTKGDPFEIWMQEGEHRLLLFDENGEELDLDEPVTHVLTIEVFIENVHPLDPKYTHTKIVCAYDYDENVFTVDKTFAEILAELLAGRQMLLLDEGGLVYPLVCQTDGADAISFSRLDMRDDSVKVEYYIIKSDDTVESSWHFLPTAADLNEVRTLANNAQTTANAAKTAANNAQAALSGKAPMYTYGTTDITAGSASSEPEGSLHFVIE